MAVFEGVTVTSMSREFAFQRPKFDTRVKESSASEGTRTDELCPVCGKREMTFTTAQLRSADEGQTIFFSCQACGYVDLRRPLGAPSLTQHSLQSQVQPEQLAAKAPSIAIYPMGQVYFDNCVPVFQLHTIKIREDS